MGRQMFKGNDEAPNPENQQKSRPAEGHHPSLCGRTRSDGRGTGRRNVCVKVVVSIDMCGLLMDVCADRCLVWGMTSEQKNVDAWNMGRRTESTVPSAIVHIERWGGNEREPDASKSTTENKGLDGGRCNVWGWRTLRVEESPKRNSEGYGRYISRRNYKESSPARVVILISPAPIPVQSLFPPFFLAVGLRTVGISAARAGGLAFIDRSEWPNARIQSTDGTPLIRLSSDLRYLPFPKEVSPKTLR